MHKKIVDALKDIQWKDHCNLEGRTNIDDKPLAECPNSEISAWIDSRHANIVKNAIIADALCDRLDDVADAFCDRLDDIVDRISAT